jgi:hypothetical protein
MGFSFPDTRRKYSWRTEMMCQAAVFVDPPVRFWPTTAISAVEFCAL